MDEECDANDEGEQDNRTDNYASDGGWREWVLGFCALELSVRVGW
jgi:hypothetical protein